VIGVIVEVEWVLFTRRMAVGKLKETSQNFVAGMTRFHITTGLSKVETSATFQGLPCGLQKLLKYMTKNQGR